MFENTVLRKLFGLKNIELSQQCRQQLEKLRYLHTSLGVDDGRSTIGLGTWLGLERHECMQNFGGKAFGDRGCDRIALRWILGRWVVR
jgi:hypothetical protein